MLVFSQEAIDTLKTQGLTLGEQNNERFVLDCNGEKKSVSLISYLISEGFVSSIPTMYMTQMFVE